MSGRIEERGFTCLRFDRIDRVLRVTIDRPGDDANARLNAVDGVLHHELAELFALLGDERDARAVVLAGSGGVFSAGGDLDWFPELQEPGRLESLRLEARQLVWDLLDVHLPIVCAVGGHAMGLGASIALLSDVVVMARTARLGDPHVRVGIVAGDGGTVAWPFAMGPMQAKRWLLTGDAMSAEEAERAGLVTEVVDDDAVDERALAWAQRLAAGAPLAVQYTKQAINQLVKDTALRSFDLATALELVTFGSADHREALAALAEKRAPRFEGR